MKSEHAELIAALGRLGAAVARLVQVSITEQMPTPAKVAPEKAAPETTTVAQTQMEHARPMTKEQVANYFGVTSRTIDSWMRAGILPYWKIGHLVRFDFEAMQVALNARQRGGKR